MDRDLRAAGERAGDAVGDPDGAATLTAVGSARFSGDWLALREPADDAARATELLPPLRAHLAASEGDRVARDLAARDLVVRDLAARDLVVRDLGCGTGSMGRWLAGRLPGAQHWVLCDRDPALLVRAASAALGPAADGAAVTLETREADVTALDGAELAGTSLVTASALLDLLTADEVDRLARACAAAGCPALLVLSVTGRVELAPGDPLDGELGDAFNAHQRRVTDGRRLLGPDAANAVTEAFARHGAQVYSRPSPWRLGPGEAELAAQWLRGWVGAARDQRPELAGPATDYLHRRLAACATGGLRVTVHHADVLALPPGGAV